MNQNNETGCSVEEAVKSKSIAQNKIIGKWTWLSTTYAGRGTETNTETPATTKKSMVYEFLAEKVMIYEDDILKEEFLYELKFGGEGTNTVDDQLVISFTVPMTKERKGNSLLFLDTSGECLILVNSYNDAGGDLNFKRTK